MQNNIIPKEAETEICIYGYIEDFENLDKANKVLNIVQLSGTLGTSGKCRCRATECNNNIDYEFTIKTDKKSNSELSSKYEYNFPIDKNYFDYFKTVAEDRHNKKRYEFIVNNVVFDTYDSKGFKRTVVVPELLFELDIFEKESGVFSNWCKIDIEIDKALDYIESNTEDCVKIELMVNLKRLPVVIKKQFMASSESAKRIADLWNNEFIKKKQNG